MGLRNHFIDYPEFVMQFEQDAKRIMDEVEEACARITVEHQVYSGERLGPYEFRISVQGVPVYARAVIIGYDGYLEFGYLSLLQGEWVYNSVSREKLSSKDTGIYLGGKEIRPGRHSLIPYINRVIESTLSVRRTLAYCPKNKTWYFTEYHELPASTL